MTSEEARSDTPAANARRARRTPTAAPAGEPAVPQQKAADPREKAPSAAAPARRRPARKAGASIVVTGAAGVIGQALLRRLGASDAVAKVLAIDVRRPEPVDGAPDDARVTWRTGDVRDPALAQRLTGADAVVHLAVDWSLDTPASERSALNVRGTQTVVTAAAAAGVARVVVVTAAAVYGALADNPTPLPEDAPLNAPAEGILADLLEMERVAQDARRVHPGLSVTVVRPAALVGPGVDTLVTRHFAAPRLLCIRDSAPAWQFCHVDDLASALELAALGRVSGAVTVGSEGCLDQARVEELSGMKRVEVPASIAFATAERLHRVGVTPAPASELAYVMHPLVVPSTALREAGWVPAYDNEANLREVLEQVRGDHTIAGRRIGRRDATVAGASAAGATVAVLGAAAFVRAARRARGR
ncbi:MAG: NAD-dependent epimerase/dehydratase family protein [Candidatus Nanopelagicales bacterium]